MINNYEVEQQVLGMIINSSDLLAEYPKISVKDFEMNDNKLIFKTVCDLYEKKIDVDIMSITSNLVDSNMINEVVGGVEYITQMISSVFTVSNFEYYYSILKNNTKKRNMLELGKAIETNVSQKDIDINEIIQLTQKALISFEDDTSDKVKHIEELSNDSYERLQLRMNTKVEFEGLTSGYKKLDKVIGGFKPSNVIILAARPAVGKTALALNLALNVAKYNKSDVAIFSLEMSADELFERMMSSESRIPSYKYKYGKLNETDIGVDHEIRTRMKELGVYVEDSALIKVNEIKKTCRKIKRENNKLGLVVIDYLQLIEPGTKGDNKQVQIAQISRELKQLAKELDVCVLALSQLSRNMERRENTRPMLSDLRDSGAIEADADIVALLNREDYQQKEYNEVSIVEMIIAKNRSGQTGDVEFTFDKSTSNFKETN